MTVDMSQFYQVFFEETEELLAEMERLLLAIDVAQPDSEDLNAIFRAAHSIKGGASTFGITDLTEVTHVLETLLDRIRKGEMALTGEHVDAFLAAKDVLKMQLDGHRHGAAVDRGQVDEIRASLQRMAQQGDGGNAARAQPPKSGAHRAAAAVPTGIQRYRIELPALEERDVKALAGEIGLLGAITESRLPDGRGVFVLDTEDSVDNIVAICSFIMDASDLKITAEAAAGAGDDPGYGFFDPLPGRSASTEDTQGYGFFEPLQSAVQQNAIENAQGYGFFEPMQSAAAQNAMENAQGYGFFAPFVPNGIAAPGNVEGVNALASSTDDTAAAAEPANAAPARKPPPKRDADKPVAGHVEASTSIRVGIEKVDQLINLVGELVITQAMIEQRVGSLDPMLHERLLNSVSQLTRNTRDLQEAVMSIRMMPMDYVFSRFPRMVRDLAGKLGKKVEFVTHGAATELDKGLIERIVDPLTHLVRNSIDHGIEMPDVRTAAGKNETGRLSLSAAHQGGNIIIEVSDDGGGLSRERILDKARQQGLPVVDTMPDTDVWQLIFAPGFSTAEVVTDVSGRGVGMDVVKRNIESMGGVVEIRSLRGFGTTISISLPLTLAILDGMSIKVGPEIYILPLAYVIESLQPRVEDIKEISGSGRVIKVRGEYLQLIPLHQMFGIDSACTEPSDGIVVILESDGRKAALFVDELVGQQQVVVKNLESNYRKVAGISGATILGDGGVSLIVDVAALLRSSRQLNDESIYTE
ncbi:chemotaxis protein CheA [Janthinobacterium sp. 17J80-10]|uniref:chemotaxis protein CheA n=1 Tax=Janthinobacterium sp. 17J80-10 TaxID=2497863 RepID=UPI0010055F2D|nr:chemotaxis protein CheA [Janthinobacterium sp. 17J80-10]QAU34321.1 chemotaxis protein CheA [Janthinobacterium sp. 17J80-10]